MSGPAASDSPGYDRFLRSLVGLMLAPVAGSAIAMTGYAMAAILHSVLMNRLPPDTLGVFLRLVATGIEAGIRIGILPTLAVGWPLHSLLLRTGFIHLATYITFSAALGVAATQIMIPIIYAQGAFSRPVTLDTALLAAAAGGVGGALFWLIRRPDRDPPRERA